MEHDDAGAEALDIVEHVRAVENRLTVGGQRGKQILDHDGRAHIEP